MLQVWNVEVVVDSFDVLCKSAVTLVSEIQKEIAPEERVCNNIGVKVQSVRDRSKIISAANANRRNKELEQAARHRTRWFN